MKKRICLAILVVAMMQTGLVRAASFTMPQAVERALKANPTVQSKMLTLEAARMNVGVAQSYFWPRVSVMSTYNNMQNNRDQMTYSSDDLSSKTWTQSVRVSWSIFAGFAHLNNLQKSLLQVDMEAARHRLARLELVANVQIQFLTLLQAREKLRTANDSVARIKKQLDAAEAFVRVDMAPYANVLQNRVELSRAEQEIIRCKNELRNAEVQLNRFLGFSPNEPVDYKGRLQDFSGAPLKLTEEQSIKTALFSRPDLIIAQKSVAVAFKDMHARMGQYLPRVDITYDNARYSRDYDDRRYQDYSRSYWAVGFNFSWELFSGGETTFGALSDRKRARALQKDYEDAMASARADVIRSLLDINATRELITTTRYGVDAARENYAMAEKRYMTSIGTITDLVDAQTRLTEAERDASQALADYQSARVRFFYNIGQENIDLK